MKILQLITKFSTGGDVPGGDTSTHVTEGLSLYLDSSNTNNTTNTLADMSGNGNDFTSAIDITTNDAGRVVLNGSQYFSNTSYTPHTQLLIMTLHLNSLGIQKVQMVDVTTSSHMAVEMDSLGMNNMEYQVKWAQET